MKYLYRTCGLFLFAGLVSLGYAFICDARVVVNLLQLHAGYITAMESGVIPAAFWLTLTTATTFPLGLWLFKKLEQTEPEFARSEWIVYGAA